MDHAIPISKRALGEHRLGNLVPSCAACNGEKGEKHFATFLAGQAERIARIKAHMARHGYQPLANNKALRQVLDTAYKEVGQIATRYTTIIDALLRDRPQVRPLRPSPPPAVSGSRPSPAD
ncbi:HNH endonuclease [Paenirhodobacter sp.]|uniref:HNH endonuclease n=1 Tax=Paenirhodobacter sp. TaxID=1965326 RepID=UPI003B504379